MHERTRNVQRESRLPHSTAVAALAVALTFGMMATAPAAAQTLLNGNFEGSPQTNGYTLVSVPNYVDAAHAWKVTLGSVNVGTGPAATACSTAGGHCVDLNGSARGRIEQVIAIPAGAKCSVTFMMSRHLQRANSSATLKTFINNTATSPASFTHSASGVTAANGQWQSQGFTFLTVGPTTTLAFESALEGAAGPQVDDVTINCTQPTPTGTLTVSKVVINATGGSAPIPPTFNMVTHCSANAAAPGVNTPVSVPPNSSVSLANQVVAGSLCSVTETVPLHIARLEACKGQGATWTVSYSPPVTIVNGSTSVLTVTNKLTCDPPTGGVLQVHKTVINTLGVPSPVSWPMTATCVGMAQIPLVVPTEGTVQAGGQLPAGTVCSVAEARPPQVQGVKACPSGTASWVMTNPGPQTIQLAATTAIIITNTLTCDKPTGTTGSLKVIKSVSNMTNGSVTLPTTYPMSVTCTPSGPTSQALAVPPGSVGVTVNNIAAPSQCVVTEAPLSPITNVKACNGGSASWTTMGSPSGPVTIPSGGTATVTIRNTLRCDPPTNDNCANPTQTTIGCRVSVNVKRTKGPLIYSVTASPAATTPTPNIAPSTSSSCAIGANVMINQTMCWFNYNTNPQSVTLTAVSSGGALPAGFSWSGACSGTNATCVVSVTQVPLMVVANFP